jgi:hypothetical protein
LTNRLNLTDLFSITGLPRSALAAFLNLDNATISRLADGRRPWRPNEMERARAFFEVVPDGCGPLVKKLRRREVRALIGPILAGHLVNNGHSRAFDIPLRALSNGAIELRSDQIVALCGKFGVDLARLVEGRGVGFVAWQGDEASLVNYDGARVRASRRAPVFSAQSPKPNLLRIDPSIEALRRPAGRIGICEPMTVVDDRLEPRYRRGEIIYIDTLGHECQHGDDVVISMKDGAPNEVGRLLANRAEDVLIEGSSLETIVVAKHLVLEMRRISFIEK